MSNLGFETVIKGTIEPLKNTILVSDMEIFREKVVRGIIIMDQEAKDAGIRPRWAKVYAVGSNIEDVKPGEWVLLSHGRWTRGVKIVDPKTQNENVIRMVDNKDILIASSTKPEG
jgi:co-chaperonin GroES (HSP10)